VRVQLALRGDDAPFGRRNLSDEMDDLAFGAIENEVRSCNPALASLSRVSNRPVLAN